MHSALKRNDRNISYNQMFCRDLTPAELFIDPCCATLLPENRTEKGLVAFLSGVPAGLHIDQAFLNRELWRRQQGFGRGGRMKIESDRAHIISGVRHGKTIGSPISILLENKDWKNWEESLPVESGDPEKHKRVASPGPDTPILRAH